MKPGALPYQSYLYTQLTQLGYSENAKTFTERRLVLLGTSSRPALA